MKLIIRRRAPAHGRLLGCQQPAPHAFHSGRHALLRQQRYVHTHRRPLRRCWYARSAVTARAGLGFRTLSHAAEHRRVRPPPARAAPHDCCPARPPAPRARCSTPYSETHGRSCGGRMGRVRAPVPPPGSVLFTCRPKRTFSAFLQHSWSAPPPRAPMHAHAHALVLTTRLA